MKDDTEYIPSDNNALWTLIDTVDLDTETDFIVIDFPDSKTAQNSNLSIDETELLEFEF